ncbi:hypothetical protein SCHPADRAFT_85737 [Schizopora paradoxa]|uniref:Uncharacterized protein n=1 Tax=Schizopora paradoxa TaxID=27342 RepID=A0A0H2S522_9AGAM|nr:hypothetical protein SCHPADRAFT_85737 [Schizopora paradoxa]
MLQWHEIKFLTYYGFAFSKDELEDLARRVRLQNPERYKTYDTLSLILGKLLLPKKKGWLRVIEKTWHETTEERMKEKFWLICVKTWRTAEDPGLEFNVEEDYLVLLVEWLESLGYSSEDREKLKVVIPGIHFDEARCYLYNIKESNFFREKALSQ